MPVQAIESHAEFEKIINSGKVVAIGFGATWDASWRNISPIFEGLSNEKTKFEGIEFYKVNVDEEDEISEEVGIQALPTFIVFKDGNKVKELVGVDPAGLEKLLAKSKSAQLV